MPERFSASNAAKHMACHASANLELAIPYFVQPAPRVGGAADHGTDMHAIFEQLMNQSRSDQLAFIKVLQYITDLRAGKRYHVLTEQKVSAEWLEPDPVTGELPKTTVDLVFYLQDELHIIDLKWGKIKVEVIDNDQLMYYARCFVHLAPKARRIKLHILQPHADNLESWEITSTELAQWADRARQAQAAIHAGDVTFGPSDHCKFCPAYPHSRGEKGRPLCPVTMDLLYPPKIDMDEILAQD